MKKHLAVAVVAAGLGTGSIATQAYEQGDIILRAGITTVVPNDDSEAIILPGVPEDTLRNGVSVDNGTALGLIGAWMINDRWALELLAATPFEHDVKVTDLGIAAGSVKHLPPTLSLQWHPRGGMPGWQPYLGVGLNYTTFFEEEVDPALGAVLGEVLSATSAKLNLDDSFGWAAQAGVDIPLNDDWALNFGVWYIDIGTTAEIRVGFEDGSSATTRFDVDIDPFVWNVGVSYNF
jgi:outer membrane protein